MQLCDLIEKDNSDSSDSEEENANDVNVILTELQQMSTHMHESAFQNIWFGANPHGIYGAVPTDLMHAFLHGKSNPWIQLKLRMTLVNLMLKISCMYWK